MLNEDVKQSNTGLVFDIQRFSLHDGPGIRTIIFLKGCPLRCLWCDNPEGMSPVPELAFAKSRCEKCGKCGPIWPERAITFDSDQFPRIDLKRCPVCGECVKICVQEALTIYGRLCTVAEVFDEVRRDRIFFISSDGGVKVSGGEPLRQPQFVVELFKLCREDGISTRLKPAGSVESTALGRVLKYIDTVLCDIKRLDSEEHRKLTGSVYIGTSLICLTS